MVREQPRRYTLWVQAGPDDIASNLALADMQILWSHA